MYDDFDDYLDELESFECCRCITCDEALDTEDYYCTRCAFERGCDVDF